MWKVWKIDTWISFLWYLFSDILQNSDTRLPGSTRAFKTMLNAELKKIALLKELLDTVCTAGILIDDVPIQYCRELWNHFSFCTLYYHIKVKVLPNFCLELFGLWLVRYKPTSFLTNTSNIRNSKQLPCDVIWMTLEIWTIWPHQLWVHPC